jgi:hypothetical protein
MTTKSFIIIWVSSLALTATSVWYATKTYYTQPISNTNPIVVSPVVSPVIPTEPNLSCELAKSELWKFRNDLPVVNVVMLEQTRSNVNLMIDGSVYTRKFLTEVSIPLIQQESGNFKLYLGIGVGTAATAGAIYCGYRLVKLLH